MWLVKNSSFLGGIRACLSACLCVSVCVCACACVCVCECVCVCACMRESAFMFNHVQESKQGG